MAASTIALSAKAITALGIYHVKNIHYQVRTDELIRDILQRKEGRLSDTGAVVIETGEFTGRSPKDKYTVKDSISEKLINWNEFNIPISESYFHIIRKKIADYLGNQSSVWVRDAYACADPRYRLNLRVVTEKPAFSLFASNMLLRPKEEELEDYEPEWTILAAPGLRLNPKECGTRQHNASIISFTHKTILIAGTGYTGELKKGIFTVLNYLLPQHKNILSMHCAANMGAAGDTALFFGLSGTGKTTLSADPHRKLIGDDEHGWTLDGIFNFEGGCYAKTIHLSAEKEPEIFQAIRTGALVENACFFPGTHTIDFNNKSITENTRVSYPLDYISNALEPSIGGIPNHIFFLTCDAYGVLPPLSKLSPTQAMYQFISGYTAKVAGTEAGIREPKSTFSACFGAPFLPLHPGKYAALLGEKLRRHNVTVWLINTGWTGGPYGTGSRIQLQYTRSMISAVLEGKMGSASFEPDPVFGWQVPTSCPEIPDRLLNPRNTWTDKQEYDKKARDLAYQFIKNFETYSAGIAPEILEAAPRYL